jgi:signal peptidase I
MKKIIHTLATFLSVLTVTSCDPVGLIVVNNYGKPSAITVNYRQNQGASKYNDTLTARPIDGSTVRLKIVCQNIDLTHYKFIVPNNYQVELTPRGLGMPIEEVVFETDNDSIVVVKFVGADWHKLHKKGIVEQKYSTKIINKK